MKKNMTRLALLGLILIIIGFGGMSFNKFNFGNNLTEYQKKWTIEDNVLAQLIVNSDYNTDVTFVQSTDGTQTVELKGSFEDKVISKLNQIHPQDGQFEINIVDDSIHFFNISFKSHNVTLTVSLPDLDQLQKVGIHFKSSNGKISNLSANDVEITEKSGNLILQSIIAEQLRIESSSGNVTGTDIQANAIVSIKSGNMNITDYSGIGTFSSRSGNIKLKQKGSSSLDVSANSGNVTLTVDPDFKGSYDLNARSGNIKSPESLRLSDDLIKVRTSSGNIRIE